MSETMADPLTTAAAAATILNGAKEALHLVANRAREAKDTELLSDVVSAQEKFLELSEALHGAHDRIRELEIELQKLRKVEELQYHDQFYWQRTNATWEGPFCSACRAEEKLVRMDEVTGKVAGAPFAECPKCMRTTQSGHLPAHP